MPTRQLRDGILSSDPVNSLEPCAELFYRRLMSVVDDHGRFDGRPIVLLAACYPLQIDRVKAQEIDDWISQCEATTPPLLQRYTVEGKPYLTIVNFGQRIQTLAKWPGPDGEQIASESAEAPALGGSPALGTIKLPAKLNTDAFKAIWARWVNYRRENGWMLTSETAREQIEECEKWGAEQAIFSIREAMKSSWKNIIWPGKKNYGPGGKPLPAPAKPRPPEPKPDWVQDASKLHNHLTGVSGGLSVDEAKKIAVALPAEAIYYFETAELKNKFNKLRKG